LEGATRIVEAAAAREDAKVIHYDPGSPEEEVGLYITLSRPGK
jgi:hypothetical protein